MFDDHGLMTEQDQASSGLVRQVAVLTAGIAAIGSNSLALSPILGDVAGALVVPPATVARAVTAYGGATALSALLLAPRIDRIGSRNALRLGLACVAVATLASALAPHWLALALAQALAGVGAGVALPATYAMATLIAPPGASSRTLGWVLGGWSISLVAGVPAAALLADLGGWRLPFLVLAALAAAASLGARLLPAGKDDAKADTESMSTLLREPQVAVLLLVCLAFMAAFYGVYTFVGEHARAALGLSAGGTGLIVLAYGIGFGAAGLGDGLLDRLGPGRVLPAALLAVALVYALMVPAPAGMAPMLALAAFWGLANHAALNSLILLLSAIRPQARGTLLGLNSAVTYLGVLVGTGAAAPIFAAAGFAPLATAGASLTAAAALLARLAVSRNSARGSSPARDC